MTAQKKPPCVNHPDRESRHNLDGEDLCQDCANAWARAEGHAAADRDAEEYEDWAWRYKWF